MEVDQSTSVSSSISSDLDDEDNDSLLKDTDKSMEHKADSKIHLEINKVLHSDQTSIESCDIGVVENKVNNDCYKIRDGLQVQKTALQDSSIALSASPIYRQNQKEIHTVLKNDENCAVQQFFNPAPIMRMSTEESTVNESCTENHLISNVDNSSCNVNNIGTSNVNSTSPPESCDETSSSSLIGVIPVDSSNNICSVVCSETVTVRRADSSSVDDGVKDVYSEKSSNCVSENTTAVNIEIVREGNFAESCHTRSIIQEKNTVIMKEGYFEESGNSKEYVEGNKEFLLLNFEKNSNILSESVANTSEYNKHARQSNEKTTNSNHDFQSPSSIDNCEPSFLETGSDKTSSATVMHSTNKAQLHKVSDIKSISLSELNGSDLRNTSDNEPNSSNENGKVDVLDVKNTFTIELDPQDDSDKLTTSIVNHITHNTSIEYSDLGDHKKCNTDNHLELLKKDSVSDNTSLSQNPSAEVTDTEDLTNNTKVNETDKEHLISTVQKEHNKCDKLVDYAGSDDDSEYDSSESKHDSDILRILEKTNYTKERSEMDHSKDLEKSSINTYSEENIALTPQKNLDPSANPNIERNFEKNSVSSSRNEIPSLIEQDFNSSSSDEEELSKNIQKALFDNENSRTSDSNASEGENHLESIEQNENQQKIEAGDIEETSIKETNAVSNEDKDESLDSVQRCNNGQIWTSAEVINSSNIIKDRCYKSIECNSNEGTIENPVENVVENMVHNTVADTSSKRIECIINEKTRENPVENVVEDTSSNRIECNSNEVTIENPVKNIVQNMVHNIVEDTSSKSIICNSNEGTIENTVENVVEDVVHNIVEDTSSKSIECDSSEGTKENPVENVAHNIDEDTSSKRIKCNSNEGTKENLVENVVENVVHIDELTVFTKVDYSQSSLHNFDTVKTIKALIEKSKTEENDNRLRSEIVTRIEELIENCDESSNTTQTSSNIVRKIEKLIKDNEHLTHLSQSFPNENASVNSSDEVTLERIEKILLENSEDRKMISVEKQNSNDKPVQDEHFTSKVNEPSMTHVNNYADLEMGVFEGSDEDSINSTDEKIAEESDEKIQNEYPKYFSVQLSEEESTDTADSDGEAEELSIEQSKRLSTSSLKRKQSMNSIMKQAPPSKKLATSSLSVRAPLKHIKCKQCNLKFPSKTKAARHFKMCKNLLSNGVDTNDGELLLQHQLVDQISNSAKTSETAVPKPKLNLSKNNINLISKKKTTSPVHHLMNKNTSTPLGFLINNMSSVDKIKNNTTSPPVDVLAVNNTTCEDLFVQNTTTSTVSQKVPTLPKPNHSLASSNESNKPVTRQVFLCAACHIYFEYWNLYLHMLEKHKRFICLYCLGMFGQSCNLSEHLLKRHSLCINYIASTSSAVYKEYTNENFILTCTTCGLILENNDMDQHSCDIVQQPCDVASQTGSSLNTTTESYPDPESFMLATMTEGEDRANRPQSVEVITLDQTSPVKVPDLEVPMQSPPRTPTITAVSRLDKLTETINEVAENRIQLIVPLKESVADTTDSLPTATPLVPSPTRFEESASAALSELEKCHKLLIEERTSDDDTESDVEDSLLKESLLNCTVRTPEKSIQCVEKAKPPEVDSTDDECGANIQDDYLQKTKGGLFDAKVVLDKLDRPVGSFSAKLSDNETSPIPPLEEKSKEDNLIDVDITQNTTNETKTDTHDSKDSTTKEVNSKFNFFLDSDISLSRKESDLSHTHEEDDDDDNRDLNDSDNENSLKIDDSVFEDDEEMAEEPPETAQEVTGPKSREDSHGDAEKPSFPAFKINPLRIKIKCGNSGDNQYERIKTETEIREKEARERRYDEAIDEVIRKSIMEYDMKEAALERQEKVREMQEREREIQEREREQKEKDEYERLQAELTKKQEEYQRMQEAYLSAQARQEEDESTEHEESVEETGESRAENTEPEEETEQPDVENAESVEKDSDERVKLIERTQDEKSSLLKEELLKKCEKLFAGVDQLPEEDQETTEPPPVQLASEDIQPMALSLDDRLENLDIRIVIKECLRTSCSICVHCYHATRIVANGRQLALHILAEHRYTPVKNDTSEDLIQFITSNLSKLDDTFFSSDTFDPADKACFVPFDNVYYCLQCSFASKHQRELTSHKRKMHPKTSQICLICKQILLNQSELLFHYCAGVNNPNPADNIYWCGICGLDNIPSAFRLMVHLRKKHNTCNVCLESCANEGKLLQHMLKHKIIHMCYKCNISYRNKQDITKHLFWKHGTESIVCKKCLQKRWSHVYHFCQPPARFTCDECNLTFKKSVTLKVHKRIHAGIFPYECTEEDCSEKFVSKKLLEKHIQWHREPPKPPSPSPQETNDPNNSEPHIDVCNVDESASPVAELKSGGKSKKKKKSKFDLNSMNLPPLNLSSESDSSDDEAHSEAPSVTADAEEAKTELSANTEPDASEEVALKVDTTSNGGEPTEKLPEVSEPAEANPEQVDVPEPTGEPPSTASNNMPDLTAERVVSPHLSEPPATEIPLTEEEPPLAATEIVPDVWDQFKSFTASLNVYRHVEDEHDYHVVYARPEKELPLPECQQNEENANSKPLDAPAKETDEERKEGEAEDNETAARGDKSADSTLNKSTSGDDSSSDSSSSSSCGSQCGSNCSCSSSSSSSSSSSDESSSDSDSSDPESRKRQEDKRQAKKMRKRVKKHSHASELNVTIENAPEASSPRAEEVHSVTPAEPPPVLPPPIAESDLDTDVSSSDEDFYDEKPQVSAPPKVEDKTLAQAPASPQITESPLPPHYSSVTVQSYPHASPHNYPPHPVVQSLSPRTPSRTPKKRKRPRMRNVPSSSSTPKHASSFKTSFKHPFMRPSPAFEKKAPSPLISSRETPPPRSPMDDSTRSSKRKRKQNRFYGYSDDEEPGEFDQDESEEYSVVRQPPLKKKLLWKPSSVSFDDRIPLPPVSPPAYDSKIRFENPFKVKVADYPSSYQSDTTPEYSTPEPAVPHSPSSSDEDPTIAQYKALSAMPPPPIVPAQGSIPLYCYCRCPYDEVSEMIACDGDDCEIEWYHFECVNILVPPKGKWYCPQCRPKYQPF